MSYSFSSLHLKATLQRRRCFGSCSLSSLTAIGEERLTGRKKEIILKLTIVLASFLASSSANQNAVFALVEFY